MAHSAQDLGWFDVELLEMDARAQETTRVEGVVSAADLENNRRLALSRLWVLGAYELVRTIAQRLRDTPGVQRDKAVALRRRFERIRIPLAKFEAARNFPDDSPIAYPAEQQPTRAIGWLLKPDVFIGRADLSDALLEFLEELASAHTPSASHD